VGGLKSERNRETEGFLNAVLSTVCDWKYGLRTPVVVALGEESGLSIEEAVHRLTGTEMVPKFTLTSFP
jgi:hypothetical protein